MLSISSLSFLMFIVTGISTVPIDIDYYGISAELPFYYRFCTNDSEYIFTKDNYLDITKKDTFWVPSGDTFKVPDSCSNLKIGTTACFLSEIKNKHKTLFNVKKNLRIHKLFTYIKHHCSI